MNQLLVRPIADLIIEDLFEIIEPLFIFSGNRNDINLGKAGPEGFEVFSRALDIHLIRNDFPGKSSEFVVIFLDLTAENFQVGNRVAAFAAGGAQEMRAAAVMSAAREIFTKGFRMGLGVFPQTVNKLYYSITILNNLGQVLLNSC